MEEIKFNELTKAAESVIEFIKKIYNPHTTVLITEESIKVVTDELYIPLNIHD